MSAVFTDEEIARLIHTPKVPAGRRGHLPSLRHKGGHAEANVLFQGDDGNEFRVILRRGLINALDFSAVLAVRTPGGNRWFRLRRYNGKSHPHRNPIEGTTAAGFHIHTATERYQRSGHREDTYAEATARYADYEGALRCLVKDANLAVTEPSPELQTELFQQETP